MSRASSGFLSRTGRHVSMAFASPSSRRCRLARVSSPSSMHCWPRLPPCAQQRGPLTTCGRTSWSPILPRSTSSPRISTLPSPSPGPAGTMVHLAVILAAELERRGVPCPVVHFETLQAAAQHSVSTGGAPVRIWPIGNPPRTAEATAAAARTVVADLTNRSTSRRAAHRLARIPFPASGSPSAAPSPRSTTYF